MGITCVEEIGVTHANLSALDTDVTWYPTENYIVVVIIQVVIFKEDILSYGVTEIPAVSQRRIFGNC